MSEFSMVTFKPVTAADQAVFASLEMLEVHLRDLRQEIEEMIANIPVSVPRNLGSITSASISTLTLPTATASRLLATDASKNVVSVSDLTAWIAAGSGITVTNDGDGTITIALGGSALTGSGTAGRVAYWSGTSTLTSTADFLFTDSSGAGVATEFQVVQPNNSNSASHSIIRIKTAGISGGDPKLVFDSTSGTFAIGIDSSDSGSVSKLKMGVTATIGLAAGSTLITMTGLSRMGFFTEDPQYPVDYATSTNTATVFAIRNLAAVSGIEHAILRMETTGGIQDPYIVMYGGGTGSPWAFGVDTSASRDFVWYFGSSLGSGTQVLKMTTAGIITIPNATDASAVGTAACVISGGLGVAKKLYLGDDLYLASGKVYRVNGTQVLTAQQSGVGAALTSSTAGASYTGTEQTMLQEAHDRIRTVMAALKTHGMIAT